MNAYFPVINEHISKRNKKVSRYPQTTALGFLKNLQLLDYDSARSKQRKLVEKPSDDPTKLPKVLATISSSPLLSSSSHLQAQQEHDDAKEVFDMLNEQLINELPQLLDLRVPYFDPSFEAMIRMQCKFAEEGYEKLSGVQRYGSLCSLWMGYGLMVWIGTFLIVLETITQLVS
jgi:hypothetical protein